MAVSTARIVRNAGSAAAQVLVSGLMFLLLYRYLLEAVGVERLGIWSVVLATTSAARISELGFTGGVVKFVAKHLAHGDGDRAGRTIETAVLALAGFVGVLLLAAWWPAHGLLARLLPPDALPEGRAILPYALLSLWITTLGGICQSALDGCQRTDLRAAFATLNSVLHLLLAMALVPAHGLLGLAWVQVALSTLLALASWTFLRRELRGLPLVPRRWSQADFRDMLRYGLNIQLSTLAALLTDPVTKALLSRFGGLATAGYYEMASRMILQLRSLLTAPNRIMVPVFAQLHETDGRRIETLYRDICRLQVFLALPFYAGIAAMVPAVSQLWIGHHEPTFVLLALLLTAGWFLNGFANPAYYANLGIGRLRWNTWSHVVTGVLNAMLGLAFGLAFGGTGVAVAWVLALVLGSAVTLVGFHVERGRPLAEMLMRSDGWLSIACIGGVVAAWILQARYAPTMPAVLLLALAATVFAAVVAAPAWSHPMRGRVLAMIRAARTA